MSRIGKFWNKTKQNIQNRVERIKNIPDRMIERAVHAILENIPDNVAEKFDDLAAEVIKRLKASDHRYNEVSRPLVESFIRSYELAIEHKAKELISDFYAKYKEIPTVDYIAIRIKIKYPKKLKHQIVAKQRDLFREHRM